MMVFQNALQKYLIENITEANDVTPNVISREVNDKYLVYQKVDFAAPIGLNDILNVEEATFQIDAYAYRKEDAQKIINQVKNKLLGFQGIMHGFIVQGIEITDWEDDYEDGTELYREMIDFDIYYKYEGVKVNE